MGVPAFFRWLVNSSPQIVTTASYKDPQQNPRIDNLYLDMNGIIHPCSHPQGQSTIPPPSTEQDMFRNISRYLDLIFELTNPQKLIYFAIDGVAPRAKMNQQRGRRFKSAQEILEKKQSKNKIINSLKDIGYGINEKDMQKESWDHNVITPGTIFMEKVSDFIKNYICKKFQNSQNFEDLVIIFSDSNVPQEGEHKILEFIRSQRNQPNYDPNTSHCIYGADADLIMLGLSTHEPNFYIIREKLEYQNSETKNKENISDTFTVQFSFIYIQIVREFLNSQTFDLNREQKWDLENIIDDFVLLCFIIGNDFLPSLPGFEIRMGGIDILLEFYKKCLKKLNGYLTFQGEVQLKNLEIFFSELSKNEYELMQSIEKEKYYHIKRMKEKEKNNLQYCRKDIDTIQKSKTQILTEEPLQEVKLEKKNYLTPKQKKQKITEAQEILEDTLKKKRIKNQLKNINDFEQFCIDGENYKQKYYQSHFKISKEDYLSFTNIIKRYYIEGIIWNFHYYYKGCCSWNWFYPFHYAPLISDLNNFSHLDINFDKGIPFTPLQQLLSVLPPFSSHALPQPLQVLMIDQKSEIIDFYPTHFEVDQRGKTVSWLGEVILPFIDGQRLKTAIQKKYDQLTQEEQIRDKLGFNILITKNNDQIQQIKCILNQIQNNQIFSNKQTIQEQDGLYFYQIDLPQDIQHRCQLLRGVTIPKRTFNISVIQKGQNKQKRYKFYTQSFK